MENVKGKGEARFDTCACSMYREQQVSADWNVGEGRREHISVIILECFLLTC